MTRLQGQCLAKNIMGILLSKYASYIFETYLKNYYLLYFSEGTIIRNEITNNQLSLTFNNQPLTFKAKILFMR